MTDIFDLASKLNEVSIAALVIFILLWGARGGWVFGRTYDKKNEECDYYKKRYEESETKYVNVLIEDIEERKKRDRTLELITQAAANSRIHE